MAAQQKRPRPGSAGDEMLKLHRRTMVLDGRVYTVVTLRPGSDFRFSTNRFHDTWHVLSDWRGARVLARLLWGLAYQRRPGTIVVIDPAHLDSNPFDGAPSDPIVLVPSELTVFTREAAVALRRRLPLRDRSEGTVRWQTFGLNHAVDEVEAWRAKDIGERSTDYLPQPTGWLRVDRIGGLITVFGAADQLRDLARSLATLGTYAYCGMDYHYLDYPETNGEVQIFRHYRSRVKTARRARTDLLGQAHRGPITEEAEQAIWSHAAAMRRNRLPRLPEPTSN
ncbi:hypothetical protein AB0M22_25830 [Nocardia sp. NPDC051756]|uniref:hypothetical protein n=1 Tax=Nocardia sp. NPDC051756 TaxID=3154751 RepID=UPI00341F23FF